MSTALDQLLATPDGYFHSFEGDEGVIVPMDRAAYVRSIFLDRRISPAGDGGWRVPLVDLMAAAPKALPMHWIFHIAHCGSTLLARALEALTTDLVLREPMALRQLGFAPDPQRLQLALGLLSRRYPGQGPVLVKANVPVNFVLGPIVATQPAARAVFLYSSLADYLLAILRSDNHRLWLRNVTGQLAASLDAPLPGSDGQLAALLWIAQMRRFAAALGSWPESRSLEAEAFFARPTETLHAAAALFGQPVGEGQIEALVAGPLFNTYSKNPAHAFGNADRLARREAVAAEVAAEIADAEGWIAANANDAAETLAAIRGRNLLPS